MPEKPRNQKIEPLPKLTYNVGECARALGVGKSIVYGKIGSGELPSRRVFGRVVVLREDLERVVAEAKVRRVRLATYRGAS